jgi:proline iminopeptidase
MTVSVPGAELAYTTRGNGPTCLVLSSIGTRPYERLMPSQLSDHLRLVFVELRGSGSSASDPAELTFDVLAEDLEAIRTDLGVERVAVLGHSILGALAIEVGRRRPDTVSHVITAGTPPTGNMGRVGAQAETFFQEDASEERKQILRENLAGLTKEASLREITRAQTPLRFFDARLDASPLFAEAEVKPAFFQHLLGTLTAGWDVTAHADSLRVPILLTQGRYDYVAPYTLWDGLVSGLPNATFQLFEGSGHHPFFEEPDLFASTLNAWMKGE